MAIYEDIIDKIKNARMFQQYNNNKQNLLRGLNGSASGTGAIGSAISQIAPSANSLVSNGIGLGGATGALGKATPFLGAAASGAQAAQDASKGDYIGAGLNGIAAGASFVPGVGTAVSMGAQALDSINKMFRSAKDQANAKAMQTDIQAMQQNEKANEQSIADNKNMFQNASEQAVQQMTQPNTYQDIINQINPQSMLAATTSPVNYQTDINTPNEEQTALDGVPTGGAASIMNMFNKNIKPLQVMDDGNGGAVLDKDATNALASQYQEPKESLVKKIMNGLGQFKAGYDDNSLNGFADGDLANKLAGDTQQPVAPQDGVLTGGAAETKKTLMNRIGEAAGTGRRLMANPWVQAGIAAGISKADGGDIGDMAKAAYQYGTAKAKSDQYYRMMNPDAKVMPVLNTYGADDYKAKAYNDFNKGRTLVSRKELYKLNNPNASDSEVEEFFRKNMIDGDEMVSIKALDSINKANYQTGKLEKEQQKINNQKDYQNGQLSIKKGQLGVAQQNANTNAGRLAETKRSNSVKETQKNRDLDIKEKKINNKNTNTKTYTQSNGQTYTEGARGTYKGKPVIFTNGKWVEIK